MIWTLGARHFVAVFGFARVNSSNLICWTCPVIIQTQDWNQGFGACWQRILSWCLPRLLTFDFGACRTCDHRARLDNSQVSTTFEILITGVILSIFQLVAFGAYLEPASWSCWVVSAPTPTSQITSCTAYTWNIWQESNSEFVQAWTLRSRSSIAWIFCASCSAQSNLLRSSIWVISADDVVSSTSRRSWSSKAWTLSKFALNTAELLSCAFWFWQISWFGWDRILYRFFYKRSASTLQREWWSLASGTLWATGHISRSSISILSKCLWEYHVSKDEDDAGRDHPSCSRW